MHSLSSVQISLATLHEYVKAILMLRRRPHLQPSRAPALCSVTKARYPATVKPPALQCHTPRASKLLHVAFEPQRTDTTLCSFNWKLTGGMRSNICVSKRGFIFVKKNFFRKVSLGSFFKSLNCYLLFYAFTTACFVYEGLF